MSLTSGQLFAGYRIIRLLGSGGMGEVYLAQHPRLPRHDALKLLPRDWSADAEYRSRFNREADLASTLWHPHIVGVHDRGEFDGQLWISMDFVDGLDAAQLLADRYPAGMPVHEATRIAIAVASALDAAHKQGLLHRDVKPANIMMTHVDDDEEQRILLTDFGIARDVNDISGLTSTNMTVGTVAYCAPEQLLGEDVDGRADQYSLAATVYHLLTGSPMFANSNPAVVISRHLNNAPPLLADARPELARLDPILAAGLAKQPESRFDRCSDFARALSEQATSLPPPAAPTAPAPIGGAGSGLPRTPTQARKSDPASFQLGQRRSAGLAVSTTSAPPSSARPLWRHPGVAVAALAGVVVIVVLTISLIAVTRQSDDMPSAADSTSTSVSAQAPSPTSTPSTTTTTSRPAQGAAMSIPEYIKQNGIYETPVKRGDPGSPDIILPFPPGWEDLGPALPAWAWGGIKFTGDPAMAQNPPTIIALLSKLQGNVDTKKILEFAPGEMKNLPGYEGDGVGSASKLGGFDAWQIGGTYMKAGVKHAVAQKTVVIPAADGVFVMQLNADGTEDQMGVLMDATNIIDEQTTITPAS